jgi:hypothetical protein
MLERAADWAVVVVALIVLAASEKEHPRSSESCMGQLGKAEVLPGVVTGMGRVIAFPCKRQGRTCSRTHANYKSNQGCRRWLPLSSCQP